MMILASASPRRRELLSYITEAFEVIPSKSGENADISLAPAEYVKELAKHKAFEVAESYPEDTVIGSDTVVCAGGEILGKPADEEDAMRMLRLLAGREHSVFTGVCVVKDGMPHTFAEETKVTFYPLTEKEIRAYAATGEPMDKAGAYGIQGRGALLISGIKGDYYNVMGLPIGRLNRLLAEIGEL